MTELIGDIVITCTGGPALTVGSAIPTANVTVSLGTQVTSRLLGNNGATNSSEALLLIDEPGSGLPAPVAGFGPGAPQSLCASPAVGAGPGGCVEYAANGTAVNGGTVPVASSSPTSPVATFNVFQGLVSANQVTFQGIPILPPVGGPSRVYRITNIRANAAGLGTGGLGSTQLLESVSISGNTSVPINNPVQVAGFVQSGLGTITRNPSNTGGLSSGGIAFPQCGGSSAPSPAAVLQFNENFGTSFKTRVALTAAYGGQSGAPPALQNVPGTIYNSESGFITNLGGLTNGGAVTGLADYGTRLKAVFNNIPEGVRIFVSVTNLAANVTSANTAAPGQTSTTSYAVLINGEASPDANGFPPTLSPSTGVNGTPATTGLYEIPQSGGSATAVWEVINTNPATNETFNFGVWTQFSANPGNNSPPPGTATVNLSYAPTPPVAFTADAGSYASSTLPIVRFADTSTGQNLFDISVCPPVSFTEFPLATSGNSPDNIVTGPDGALWLTEFASNKIGRIAVTGAITEFPIPTSGSQPYGITSGPDGALWFTEYASSKIGRITTAGAIGEYPITTVGGAPIGITTGPDGALWFVEDAGNKVGRITTAGAVTEYPISSPAWGITTGPDGALWFTEYGGNKIGRITAAGVVSEFPIPTAGSQPNGITVGPDSALWFTEYHASQIGRITTAGVFSEFPTPTANVVPYTITPGPDGALWFTESTGNKIGRISVTGQTGEYAVPTTGSGPLGIATGPDGALWFTESNGNKVARAALAAATTTCTFSLPQASLAFTSAGGAGTVAVRAAAGCSWTTSNIVPWVTITSGSGTGDGMVTLTVAANPSATPRFAILTIANQPFTITQTGTATTLSCTGAAAAAPQVTLEGRTELLGDYLLNCSGLTATLKADLLLTLNTNVTNALNGGATDTVLTVNGSAAQNGQVAGYNLLRWPAVNLVPAVDGTAIVRITNVRADASLLATLGNFQSMAIAAQAGISALTPVPVIGASQTLATAALSLAFTKKQAVPPTGGAQTTIPLVYQEARPTGFQAGMTRLRMVLSNIPGTVQVFAPVFPQEGNSRAQLYSADATGLGGSAEAGTAINGIAYQQLTPTAGSATATWLVLAADAAQIDTYTFPLLVMNATAGDLNQILVSGSLAPVSDVSIASAAAPVPRYRDFSVPQKLVNLRVSTSVQVSSPGGVSPLALAAKIPAAPILFATAPQAVTVGSNVTYTSQLLNDTSDPTQSATNVVVRDNLPSGLNFVGCSATGGATCSGSGNQIQVTYATLAPGQTAKVTVQAQVDPSLAAGTVVENPVSASSDEANLDLLASTASSSFIVLIGTPGTVASSPASGGGYTQSFTFQFSHPSGYQYLGVVNVLFNSVLDGRNACYMAYVTPANTLYLVDTAGDAGGPFAGSLVLGSAGTIENSQCAVSLTSATGSGNTLTLVLNITFKPAFGGNQITYVAARDQGQGNSNWQASGVWQVPIPQVGPVGVTDVDPPRGGGSEGTPQSFAFSFTDTQGTGDFGIVNVLINNVIDGRQACYVAYESFTGNLFLVDDAGDAGGPFAGSMPLNGGSSSVQNSQCAINGTGSLAAFAPNKLTLTLNIVFKVGFKGNQILYAAGRDRTGGNNTGWQAVGSWTVQ